MKGSVSKLCDIDSIAIPEELLKVSVDESCIEDGLKALSLRYAAETAAETVETCDIVHCRADKTSYPDGRTILIFTGANLPGAEEAAASAIGKRVGEGFSARLFEKNAELCVEKIVRLIPAEVNDALIAALGIENVSTVDEYREYLRVKAIADKRRDCQKAVIHHLMDTLIGESEYSYDEAELEQFISRSAESIAAEYAEMGIEASPEEIREDVLGQQKQSWLAEEFCRSHGIEIDEAQLSESADQMLEMMQLLGEELPPREEIIEMSRQNMCLDELFNYMDGIVAKRMGGSNGNA